MATLFLAAIPSEQQSPATKHTFVVFHPSIDDGLPFEYDLTEEFNHEFHTEVSSVICFTHECKMVPIEVYWTAIGDFVKYELMNGYDLEKTEGAPFTAEDHVKLNKVLSNPNNKLRTVDISKIKDYNPDEVDAVSSATIVIDEDQIVKGAAWTCYTLWHWVYGPARQSIRDVTGDRLSSREFIKYLNSSSVEDNIFAFEQLSRKRFFNDSITSELIQLNQKQSKYFTKQAVSYLELMESKLYRESLKSLYKHNDPNKRVIFINSLNKQNASFPNAFWEDLISKTVESNSYQEVSLYLDMLEQKEINSEQINNSVLTLLDHQDKLIARRAQWYLEGQSLTKYQSKQLKKQKTK